MISKIENRSYEELSESLFGDGNCFSESEVRKRMYGMKRLIEILDQDDSSDIITRILSLSDFHVPFQLPITIFSDYVGKIDILQLNGISEIAKLYQNFQKRIGLVLWKNSY